MGAAGVDVTGRSWRLGGLAAILAVTYVAAGAGAIASVNAARFYAALAKPGWAPAPWVFGPVWTVLYTLIAIGAWMVVGYEGWRGARLQLILYGVQLVVNASWTWLFFALHSGSGAFVDIVALVVLIIATLIAFWRVRPLAGALLAPYLAWVMFASALTWSIWMLNPGTL